MLAFYEDSDIVGDLNRSYNDRVEPVLSALDESLADVLDDAVTLYLARQDKQWSLTDCTSFVAMQREKITEALTGDHHFEQAGFVILLK